MSDENALHIQVAGFDGPLDLLLHLIREMKVDIFDIPIAPITEQYFRYLRTMQDLKLDIAGDYILMAATLLEIKSRMLLPRPEPESEAEDFYEEGEDPREELVNQLLEYRQVQEAARILKQMEVERGDFFTKPPTDLTPLQQSIPLTPGEVSAEDLFRALQKMYQKLQKKKPLQARLEQEGMSVEETMEKILQRFSADGAVHGRLPFTAFFNESSRSQIVTTFLAMLELVRERKVSFQQEKLYGEIFLESLRGEEGR